MLTDATVHRRAELVPITPSDQTFGPVTLTAHTCGALLSVSEELLQDAINGGNMITAALSAKMANEMDRVILEGSGVGEELAGILAWVGAGGVQTIAHNGDPTDWLGLISPIAEKYGTVSTIKE